MKREFLMLAHVYEPKKYGIGGWWASEKLDGQRFYWDGGISRGIPKNEIPWANTAKDARYTVPPIATGLWSRYGNVIHAPGWWLDQLPPLPLDGELWRGYGHRQDLMSVIKKINPVDVDWRDVKGHVFDAPSYEVIFSDGVIDTTNFKIRMVGVLDWLEERTRYQQLLWRPSVGCRFESTMIMLDKFLGKSQGAIVLHPQRQLPMHTHLAEQVVQSMLDAVLARGGEGLMIRDGNKTWQPGRVHYMLKVKPAEDMEGTVIGYITGRETDKGSKLLGKMGALILELDDGTKLELSGFTDEERRFETSEATRWAEERPYVACPDWITNPTFPRGCRVSFHYRGKSKDGVPQEARYWRKDERV